MKIDSFHTQVTEVRVRGFTLVEALIAITILLLVIIGPMTIAAKGMQGGFYANEQMTAVYLAQEGIEWVQKLRDDMALSEYQDFLTNGANANGDTWSWLASVSSCTNGTGCDVDVSTGNVRSCDPSTNCNLKLNTSALSSLDGRAYGYDSGPEWESSMFTRVIKIGTPVQESGEDVAVPVTVTVSWMSNILGDREVVVQTWVYDQYKRFE